LALRDLDLGVVDPLLKPALVSNKPADPSSLWEARERVALQMHLLILSGKRRRQAATEVAKTFPEIAKLDTIRSREPRRLATRILSWYDDFKQGKVKNRHALALFRDGCKTVEELVQNGQPTRLIRKKKERSLRAMN
jgi:hypothetical protein